MKKDEEEERKKEEEEKKVGGGVNLWWRLIKSYRKRKESEIGIERAIKKTEMNGNIPCETWKQRRIRFSNWTKNRFSYLLFEKRVGSRRSPVEKMASTPNKQ